MTAWRPGVGCEIARTRAQLRQVQALLDAELVEQMPSLEHELQRARRHLWIRLAALEGQAARLRTALAGAVGRE